MSQAFSKKSKSAFLPKIPGRHLAPVGLAVQKITAPLMEGPKVLWAQMALQWPQIVGTRWASQTRPEKLSLPCREKPEGILHVLVWGGNGLGLTYEATHICDLINQYFGFCAVHHLKWRVLRSPPPLSEDTPSPSKNRPLEHAEKSWLEETVSMGTEATEENLHHALMGFGEALLTQTKEVPSRPKRPGLEGVRRWAKIVP